MLAQLYLCTPKDLVTLDTVPHARPGLHAPHSHWVDAASDPHRILLFLDAARVHETVIAHELGHVWLDLVEGVEDHRVLEDLSEAVRYSQVQLLQSFVLNFAVNDLVRRKGFDLGPILDDRRVMLDQMAVAVANGYRPPTPWEAVQMASLVAEALVRTPIQCGRTTRWRTSRMVSPRSGRWPSPTRGSTWTWSATSSTFHRR